MIIQKCCGDDHLHLILACAWYSSCPRTESIPMLRPMLALCRSIKRSALSNHKNSYLLLVIIDLIDECAAVVAEHANQLFVIPVERDECSLFVFFVYHLNKSHDFRIVCVGVVKNGAHQQGTRRVDAAHRRRHSHAAILESIIQSAVVSVFSRIVVLKNSCKMTAFTTEMLIRLICLQQSSCYIVSSVAN